MTVMTPISQIQLYPGSIITIPGISWQEFEEVLEELGDKRSTRIAYSKGILEIMLPLPEHERSKILIADVVKALLKAQRQA